MLQRATGCASKRGKACRPAFLWADQAFARPFDHVVRAAWFFYAINTHLAWMVEENFYACVRKSDCAALQMQRLQHVIYAREVV